jgi:hypothetical protein
MFIRKGFVTNSSSTSYILWNKTPIDTEFLENVGWDTLVGMAKPLMKRTPYKELSKRKALATFKKWGISLSVEDIEDILEYRRKDLTAEDDEFLNRKWYTQKDRERAFEEIDFIRDKLEKGFLVYLYNCEDLQGINKKQTFSEWAADASTIGFMLQQYSHWWPIDPIFEDNYAQEEGMRPLKSNRIPYTELKCYEEKRGQTCLSEVNL